MKIIPAIDIRGGKVVRLYQGDYAKETIYKGTPLDVAERWAAFDIDMLHIVDLDGALAGKSINLDIVKEIISHVRVPVELGGGLRDEESIAQAFGAGVTKVVLGTRALDIDFLKRVVGSFGDRIVVGIDAKDSLVRTRGWRQASTYTVMDFAVELKDAGVKTVNFTDISKDGTLEGPNIDSLRELLRSTDMEVIASGGISRLQDIEELMMLNGDGLAGFIIGKALYEGTVMLEDVIAVCRGS